MNIQDILGAPPPKARPGGNNELGQEDFLKLLVAQMKNQDPSNPADNGEFLSQIAQFSMVSGIDDLGTSFKGMSNNYYATQAMQAAELVGREVLTEMDTVLLEEEGGGVNGVVLVPEHTDGLNIQVRNIHGALVKTIDAGDYRDGDSNFAWDGTTEDGKPAGTGEYTISATVLIDGKQQAIPVQTYNRVESITVDRASASVALHLQNRHSVSFSQVNQYR
ncbi:MAG TPA: flagellar hook capping FlgD N-terminal domain-containing protein [Pseudomonadales bacterium]